MDGEKSSRWTKARKFVGNWWSTIFHSLILVVLTVYVLINWNVCISMRFFSEFNGNNILFFVWIALLFLTLYDVEAKGLKVKRRELKKDFEDAEMRHEIDMMEQKVYQASGVSFLNPEEEPVSHGSSN